MSGAWIKGASFRRGFLDKLKDTAKHQINLFKIYSLSNTKAGSKIGVLTQVVCPVYLIFYFVPIYWIQMLCRCSTGTDPTTLGSVAKVVGSWKKGSKNAESVMKSPTGQYSYRQVVMAITTRRRVWDIFCMASRRSTTTSPKPLRDKPYHKQTDRKDKQASLEHVPDPFRQD